MDKVAIEITEGFAQAGYPLDVEAMLIIEVEGSDAEIDEQLRRIVTIAERHNVSAIKVSRSEAESAAIWKGRKSAFGATGRISDYICMDGTIPTGQLPLVLRRIDEIVKREGLKVANWRRKPASFDPVRHQQAGRDGESRARRGGHPQALRRSRRLPDGRARGRYREARPDALPI
jgi:FAD/FMN-containing dehydrogenase